MATYPFPDTLDVSTNDLIVWLITNLILGVVYVCSEDIIAWLGIPNDHEAKERMYDSIISRRKETIPILALSTPIVMVSGLRAIATILGLGPIGACCMWAYVLYSYKSRNRVYIPAEIEYDVYNAFLFLLTFLGWHPGTGMLHVAENLTSCAFLAGMTIVVRVFLTKMIGQTEHQALIPAAQHILWDPLTSYVYLRDSTRSVIAYVKQSFEHLRRD